MHSIANSIVVLLKVLITKIQNAGRSYFILVNITVLTMNVWYVKMNYTEKCTTVMCSKMIDMRIAPHLQWTILI